MRSSTNWCHPQGLLPLIREFQTLNPQLRARQSCRTTLVLNSLKLLLQEVPSSLTKRVLTTTLKTFSSSNSNNSRIESKWKQTEKENMLNNWKSRCSLITDLHFLSSLTQDQTSTIAHPWASLLRELQNIHNRRKWISAKGRSIRPKSNYLDQSILPLRICKNSAKKSTSGISIDKWIKRKKRTSESSKPVTISIGNMKKVLDHPLANSAKTSKTSSLKIKILKQS